MSIQQSDDRNPLQRALDNYLVMELQCEAARREASEARTESANLLAEVGMLRERLHGSEIERRKWEATAATLLGRLLAIHDTIAGAVKAAAHDGLEATKPQPAASEATEPAQSAGTEAAANEAPEEKAAPEPSQGASGTAIPVDFGPPRRAHEFRR